jgi:hypothetical protein
MDVIHVHVEKGREHGKVKGNTALEIDDYLWTMHESWCRVKPPLHSNLKTIALKEKCLQTKWKN